MKKIFIISIILFLFLFPSCNQSKKEIVKWEYILTSISDLNFQNEMNSLGVKGWELVFARRARSSSGDFTYETIFKRPLLNIESGKKGDENLTKKMEEKDTKGKIVLAMMDLKSIGTAIEAYLADFSSTPKVESYKDLNADWFVPFYIKQLPQKDPWGNPYYYKHGVGDKADMYWIACAGTDGKFEGFNQEGEYLDFNGKDIIFSNGLFTYCLKTK